MLLPHIIIDHSVKCQIFFYPPNDEMTKSDLIIIIMNNITLTEPRLGQAKLDRAFHQLAGSHFKEWSLHYLAVTYILL